MFKLHELIKHQYSFESKEKSQEATKTEIVHYTFLYIMNEKILLLKFIVCVLQFTDENMFTMTRISVQNCFKLIFL